VMMSALCSGLLDNMTFYFQRGLAIQFQAQVLKKVHKQKTRTNREGNIGYSRRICINFEILFTKFKF
jgi:hypothetical protein